MTALKSILVTGATGKQGRAIIDALLAKQPSPPIHIIAVTRDPSSKSAQSLSALPNVTVVAGDLSSPNSMFSAANTPIWGVYSVQINSDAEITQGKALIDASLAAGVSHFVYSSGDRGGPEKSDVDPTTVKNFAAKFEIEKHLQKQCAASATGATSMEMTYTILRPVTFFENQTTDKHGAGFGRMWEQTGRKIQMIATKDIGWFGAEAFLNSEDDEFRNRALSLAGDELSAEEAQVIFKQETGKDMPMAPCLVGSMVKFFLKDTVGDMFKWFETNGYGADLQACRKRNPGMMSYRTWLRECSPFVKA